MVLYQKYRPKLFSEVIGQKHIIKILESELRQNKIANAYLFTGPRGIGKTTVARLLAKALNCQNRKPGESEPCNQCENCQAINQGKFLDLIEIDAASHTGVDNVRENIIANTRTRPVKGKYKVFIIDEVHMLSSASFNALLKTLEEPPPYVVFVLATTEIHKVPETIISRCQRFDFTKVSFDEIVSLLKKIAKNEAINISDDILKNVAYHSEGCVRDAESLLSQIIAVGGKTITKEEAEIVIPKSHWNLVLEFIDLIFKNKAKESILLLNKLVLNGVDLNQFTKDLVEMLRKILLVSLKVDDENLFWRMNENEQRKIKELANSIPVRKLVEIIEEFVRAQLQINSALIPQLPLEISVTKICQK
ncbi:DNA polymerase III subunit gamma/tau [bacterium]|nr:DNA polymerase III subunit gamma/tau [bacterium]